MSAVESRQTGPGVEPRESLSSAVAGQLVSTSFGGADSRAYTDFGVNKIYSSGTATNRQYATSNWVDTFTVAGTPGSNVTVSFTFAIDGNINVFDAFEGPNATARANFSVYALRGDGWALGGQPQTYSGTNPFVQPTANGDLYSELWMRKTTPDQVNLFNAFQPAYYQGYYRYQNNAGVPGAGGSRVIYDEATDTYTVDVRQGVNEISTIYTPTGSQTTTNGVTGVFRTYANLPPNALTTRNNLRTNHAVLDVDRLCPSLFNSCITGDYPGTDLTVSFTLAAGSSFTLLSSLHAYDLYDEGTVDFFSTAKVTGVSVSDGGSLTSLSGALQALPEGGYGYPAALASVPEPASWAMLIAGFGLVGGMMRWQRRMAGGASRPADGTVHPGI